MFSRKVRTAKTGNEIASCCHTSRRSHHSTIFGGVFTAVIVLLAAACDPIQGSGAGNPPDPAKYIHVDEASRAAVVTLVAAYPATDFQFNYDGYGSGSLVLTVPVGWQVTVQSKKRLAVLRWLVEDFQPGRRYPEREVNQILGRHHPDFAALRRYLVDEELMQRSRGIYWRTGSVPNVGFDPPS